jgi:hypothetical protein
MLTPAIAPTPTPAPTPAPTEPTAQNTPPVAQQTPAEQGLDLDAELARAEAAAEPEPIPAVPTPDFLNPAPSTASAVPDPAAESAPDLEPEPEPEPALELELDPESTPNHPSGVDTFAALSGGTRALAGEELALIVDADSDYYAAQLQRGDIIESEFPFPKYPHERRFTFVDGPVRIGRASASRGLNPEIDLTGPPLDPAVSHLHAQLLRHDEGWVVVDLGSANGTRLNDAEEPLEAETEIPVKQGDRIHLGVWTTITVQ